MAWTFVRFRGVGHGVEVWLFLEYHNVSDWQYKNSMRTKYLSAMTISCFLSSSLTFLMKRGAGFFFPFTSSLSVSETKKMLDGDRDRCFTFKRLAFCAKKKKKERREDIPHPGMATGTMISFPEFLHTFRLHSFFLLYDLYS